MSITLGSWLHDAEIHLKDAGVETARLDCLVLLSDELVRDKSWVLAHPEHQLEARQVKKLDTRIAHRARHTPLAYLRGHAEFYGRDFLVNADVLVPRPESEDMIGLLEQIMTDEIEMIYDIGTGSGALAITAKLEFPRAAIVAIDIDNACLATAQNNAKRLCADITLLQGDLLEPIQKAVSGKQKAIILANLPYVPIDYPINKAAAHEPKLALYSGTDGLDHYRKLFAEAAAFTAAPAHIITESLFTQHEALVSIAAQHGYRLTSAKDLAQLFTKA